MWFERARHTALGGIILGTGLIAGLSMWTAINASFGYESLLHLLPALIWFVFIISLDRALVSTMFGAGRRWGAFLMRLALAIMFGFIIAEPFTIRIFQTAIEEHIRDERTQELADLQSTLLACNTKEVATGTAPAPAGCEAFLLSFDARRSPPRRSWRPAAQDEAALAATVAADDAELARLQDPPGRSAPEPPASGSPACAATPGVPRPQPRRGELHRHPSDAGQHHPARRRARGDRHARRRGGALAGEVRADPRRTDRRPGRGGPLHQGPIGLLERMNALHELAATSAALFLGTWAVRLFFILADCLPVVVKFSGGSSEYDKIVRAQATGSVRRHAQEMEILRAEADHHVHRHRADLDLELQELRADASLRRGEAVRKVSDHLLNPRR